MILAKREQHLSSIMYDLLMGCPYWAGCCFVRRHYQRGLSAYKHGRIHRFRLRGPYWNAAIDNRDPIARRCCRLLYAPALPQGPAVWNRASRLLVGSFMMFSMALFARRGLSLSLEMISQR